ncbi:MAG: hypothetical protein ACRDHY_12175, partial [Anaerolineales bacterium]
MGLARVISLPLLCAAIFLLWCGCRSDKRRGASSESFLAPQLIDVDPTSGQNAQGERAIEVLVDKLTILREVHRNPITGETKLDGELLDGPSPLLSPIGKLDEDRLLVYDTQSKTVLTIDLIRYRVEKVMATQDFLALFRSLASKPVLDPVIQLQNGWILGYESVSRALFAMRRQDGGSGIIAHLVLDQSEMRAQLFPPPTTPVAVTIKSLTEFSPNQVLMVPAATNIAALHHLQVHEDFSTGERRLVGQFILLPSGDPVPRSEPFLHFDLIRAATSNVDIDLREFPPVPIPRSQKILLFDSSRDTSSFIEVTYRQELFQGQDIFRVSLVDVTVDRDDMSAVVAASIPGGQPFQERFQFLSSFIHPGSTLDPNSPDYAPFVLAFEEKTNNLLAYDFSAPEGAQGKIQLLSSATQVSNRTDINRDPAIDTGTFDPQFRFAVNDVTDNRLAWDSGPDELVSLNYST